MYVWVCNTARQQLTFWMYLKFSTKNDYYSRASCPPCPKTSMTCRLIRLIVPTNCSSKGRFKREIQKAFFKRQGNRRFMSFSIPRTGLWESYSKQQLTARVSSEDTWQRMSFTIQMVLKVNKWTPFFSNVLIVLMIIDLFSFVSMSSFISQRQLSQTKCLQQWAGYHHATVTFNCHWHRYQRMQPFRQGRVYNELVIRF